MPRVSLENVCVEFPIYGRQEFSLRNAIAQRAIGGAIERDVRQKDRVIVRALSDVNLQLEDGDRLGLVGHNGSGKSTLLKVISGIYEPVRGNITVAGRITPLFDMMPGLDVEDTGYENIITSGMLLGMTREQVIAKIPEIEEVSELGDYLSLPVRTYSAGMSTRLGFALVTALDPDVLIMDEGFGAADLRFTKRTAERMNDFIGRSRVLVLATHSDAMLQSICNKAALMKEGRILSVGPVEQIFEEYHIMVYGQRSKPSETAAASPSPMPVYSDESIAEVGLADRLSRTTGAVRFSRIVARDHKGSPCWSFPPGATISVEFNFVSHVEVSGLSAVFRLLSEQDGSQQILTDFIEVVSAEPVPVGATGAATFVLPNNRLRPGKLRIYASLVDANNTIGFDVADANVALPELTIEAPASKSEGYLAGMVSVDHKFECSIAAGAQMPLLIDD